MCLVYANTVGPLANDREIQRYWIPLEEKIATLIFLNLNLHPDITSKAPSNNNSK